LWENHVLWEKSENTWGKEETMFQTGKVNATCIPPGDFAKFWKTLYNWGSKWKTGDLSRETV
jgi:hypothetical protein